MSTPPLSKEEWLKRKGCIEDALRKGYPPPGTAGIHGKGAIAIAAHAMKMGPAFDKLLYKLGLSVSKIMQGQP